MTEEFRAHVDAMSSIAEALADHLRVPQWLGERRSSEEVIESLWRTEFCAGFLHRRPDWRDARRKDERVVRRNRLLFTSLKEHTRDAMRSELLDAWKKSWDVCVATLDRVSKLGERVMSGHYRQESGFQARVEDDTAKKDAAERMLQVVARAVWRHVSSRDKSGRRPVALSPSLAIVLHDHQAVHEATRAMLGTAPLSTDIVFSHPDDRPLRPDSVNRAFKRMAKTAGIRGSVSMTFGTPTQH